MIKRSLLELFLVIGMILVIGGAVFADSPEIQWTETEKAFMASHPEINLGVDPKFIPYEFIDTDGQYKGIAADYLKLISKKTGLTFTVAPDLTWSESYEKAVERQLDALPCISRTPERERYFLFSDPYYSFIRAIVLNEETTGVNGFEDLKGKVVAVQQNSSHHSYLKAYPDIQLSLYKTAEEALSAVAEGKEAIFIGNYATAMFQIKSTGYTNLKYVKFDLETRQSLYFAVRTDWPELVGIINKALSSVTVEEKLAIDNRWIGVENQTEYGKIMKVIGGISAILFGIFAVSFFWIIKLRREIARRTKVEKALALAKEDAETANRIKSLFLARMSHEIRTPLNAITGMTYLVKKTDITVTQRIYLDKIVQASRNMLGIINDILDFSKIEAGKIVLETIPFNLDKVLQQIITIVSFKVEEQGIEFAMNKDPSLPCHYIGDPIRIEQILLNIISNAVKFTEKGIVTVEVYPVDPDIPLGAVAFRIKDTGIGMAPEQVEALFEPFNQADASINRRFGGTGLGMSIVRSLVDMMLGKIHVESSPGQGSAFTIQLPLVVDQAKEVEEKSVDNSRYFKDIKALVIEKHETYLNLLKTYLSSFGIDAQYTALENEAVEWLQEAQTQGQKPYNLCIIDYETPESDGVHLIQKIKNDSTINQPPKFILMAPLMQANVFDQINADAIDLGITKPLIPSVLYNGIIELFKVQLVSNQEERNPSEQAARFMIDYPVHVLIVEDNMTNQFIAKSILEQAGFRVSLADNGQQGVEFFEQHGADLDLILMDLHMPVMNGYEATAAIRNSGSQIPIIAMTADAISGVDEECRRIGLTEYVTKPFEPEVLLQTLVDTIMAIRRSKPPSEDTASILCAGESEINILDKEDGIRRIGNNPALYRMVLEEYRKENQDVLEELKQAIHDHNYSEAILIVHKNKSSTGNIGAKNLFNAGSVLQEALKSADEELVSALLLKFEKDLNCLMYKIDSYMEQ